MYRHLSKVVLFSLLGLLTFVYAQETTETSVDPAVRATLDQGKKLLLSSNFEQAAALMRQIVAVDPRNGQAQFYLGLATIGPKKVRRNRDNAAKCFLASAEAGYHLPFGEWENFPVHQGTYIDANWNPAKKIMGEKDPQQLETATHLLENIVSVDHRAHHASERLGELYVDTGQNRKALDLFQRLLEANPDKSESVYDMGLGYMDIYNKERAEAILADLSSEGPEKMTALSKLLMARAFFVIGDNRIASVYYSQCLDDMNEIAAREIYRDIIDIISKNEKQEYKQARTIDQKKAFFRKFCLE
ncbi:MAG: tetratricopeptide repeat protein [Gemmatimonadota bacterium]|nr:tetratricopeptide repeat protein [Gemmatimonadota bacterium]